MVFDRTTWRKEYTKSDKCVSGKVYKANRRADMGSKERTKYEAFLEHLGQFEQLMIENTSVICLFGDGLEADDFAGKFVELYSEENQITLISTDKDYMQLLGFPNVKLIDPATGKERDLDEYNNDAEYFMFFKCLRGDAGDNVQSAYPRIRKTKILKAYENELDRVNMMNETWTNHEGKEMLVKDVFKENELLMDLRKQPEEWRVKMKEIIEAQMEDPGVYSYFHFMKFLGKFEMHKVASNAPTFAKMLSR